MARAVRNIVDDIKNRIRTEGVTAEEIMGLFEEAYTSLSSDENFQRSELDSLKSTMKNILKTNKELFNEEQKSTLYEMRDTKGQSISKASVESAKSEEEIEVEVVANMEAAEVEGLQNDEVTLEARVAKVNLLDVEDRRKALLGTIIKVPGGKFFNGLAHEDDLILADAVILGADGKPLSDEETRAKKEEILKQAQEIAIQNIRKEGSDRVTDRRIEEEVRNAVLGIISDINTDEKDGALSIIVKTFEESMAKAQTEAMDERSAAWSSVPQDSKPEEASSGLGIGLFEDDNLSLEERVAKVNLLDVEAKRETLNNDTVLIGSDGKRFNAFAHEDDLILADAVIMGADGKPLSDEEARAKKEEILKQAQEMAIQNIRKDGADSVSRLRIEQEVRNAVKGIILAANAEEQDGRFNVAEQSLDASLGTAKGEPTVEAELVSEQVVNASVNSGLSNKEQIEFVNQKIKEIEKKANDADVTADEIIGLFGAAYANLPSNDASKKSAVKRLEDIERKIVKKKKDLFTEEKKAELSSVIATAASEGATVENTTGTELSFETPQNEDVIEFTFDDPQDERIIEIDLDAPQGEPKTLEEEVKEFAANWKYTNLDTGKEYDGKNLSEAALTLAALTYKRVGNSEIVDNFIDEIKKGKHPEFKDIPAEELDVVLNFVSSFAHHKDLYEDKKISKEAEEILETLGDMNALEILSFIENPMSKKDARAAISSEKPEEALGNVNDLIVAHKYFGAENKKADIKDCEILNGITISQLEALISDPSSITPSNAAAFRLLCERCPDSSVKSQALEAIAKSLKEYDNEHFGARSAEELNSDYLALQERAGKVDLLNVKGDKKENTEGAETDNPEGQDSVANEEELMLANAVILDEEGKPLSEEEARAKKEALLELAREKAIQNLLKEGNANIDDDRLRNEIVNVTNRILLGANGQEKEGKLHVSIQGLATSIACIQNEAVAFKDRVVQKFKNTEFVKNVTERVNAIDKKLEDKYGKFYRGAKEFVKFSGNVAYSVAKGSLMFAAAGLVPGGTAVLLGYNIYKSWKGVAPQLKDKNNSLAKKVAIVAGTAITSTLSMAAMAVGLQAGAENLSGVSEGLSTAMQKAGDLLSNVTSQIASLGGTICSPEAISSAIGSMGMGARIATVSAAVSLGNMVDGIGLRIKRARVNRKLKKTDKDDPNYQALLDEKEKITKALVSNRWDALKKTGATAGGMAFASAIAPLVNDAVHGTVDKVGAMVPDGQGADAHAQDGQVSEAQVQNGQAAEGQVQNGQAAEGQVQNGQAAEVQPTELEQQQAENLTNAKVAGSSGIGDKSSYDHTVQHLDSLGDSRIADTSQMADKLCENFGDDANKVAIACKMGPYALQNALDLDLPEGVRPTSYQMLDYLAEHPLTPEQQAKLDDFMNENFDGTRFKTENYPDWNKASATHTVSNANAPQNVAAESPTNASAQNTQSSEAAAQVTAEKVVGNATGSEQTTGGTQNTQGSEAAATPNSSEQEVSEIDKFMQSLSTEDDKSKFIVKDDDGKVVKKYVFTPGKESVDGPREMVSAKMTLSGDHREVMRYTYNDGSELKVINLEADNSGAWENIRSIETDASGNRTVYKDGHVSEQKCETIFTKPESSAVVENAGNEAAASASGAAKPADAATNTAATAKPADVVTNTAATAKPADVITNTASDVRVVSVEMEAPATYTQANVQHQVNVAYEEPNMNNPFVYARENGLVYDERLSNGLDRIGDGYNFDGYAGAFYDVHDPNKIVILTNDRIGDSHHEATLTRQEAVYWQSQDGRMYSHNTHDHHSGGDFCPDRKVSHCSYGRVGYYSDGGSKFWNTVNKIDAGVHIASDVTHQVSHIAQDISHIVGVFKGR